MKLFLLFAFLALVKTEETVETNLTNLTNVTSPEPEVSTASGVAVVTDAPPASTQPDTNITDYRVCRADAERFCSAQLNSSNRSELCVCMSNHLSELSSDCAAFVLAKKAEREAAREACGDDVTKFCPEARQQGRWEIRRCLKMHYNELSSTCVAYIQKKMASTSSDACDNDIAQLCPSASSFGTTLSCLKENMNSVSSECLALLYKPSKEATGGWSRRHRKHDKDDDDDEKGWKHHEKKREKKSRKEQANLNEICGQDISTFCSDVDGVHDTKQCLAKSYVYLDSKCAEYLIASPSDVHYGAARKHHRLFKMVAFAVVGIFVVVAICACRKRCKRRREMWRQAMAARTAQNNNYIAVPTTPTSINPSPQQIQMTTFSTAPQTLQPQPQAYNPQGVVYTASPYTGASIPVTAVPLSYNPQAMTIA